MEPIIVVNNVIATWSLVTTFPIPLSWAFSLFQPVFAWLVWWWVRTEDCLKSGKETGKILLCYHACILQTLFNRWVFMSFPSLPCLACLTLLVGTAYLAHKLIFRRQCRPMRTPRFVYAPMFIIHLVRSITYGCPVPTLLKTDFYSIMQRILLIF